MLFVSTYTSPTLAEAELAIATETFVSAPATVTESTLRAFLIIKKGISDLSVAADAAFIAGTKSRLSSGAGGGGGAGGGADVLLSNLTAGLVAINTSLISDTDSTDDLGSTGLRWANLWVDDITTTTSITLGGDINITSGFIDITEDSTPGNPAANVGRLYVADVTSTTTLLFRDSAGVETDLLAGGAGDPDQNLWETITSDSGSAVANTITDTITFAGGTAISTAVSGDTLTINATVATTGAQGVAELATTVETTAGTDTGRTIPVSALPLQIQNSKYTFAADAGASDTYVITLVPAPGAYAAGQIFHFTANTVNTGAATLNVNGLGAVAILKNNDVVLANGDIEAGQAVSVMHDGTSFQMLSQLGNAGGSAADHVITSGSGAPVSTPANVGDVYVDTNNNQWWTAVGTAGSSDWRQNWKEEDNAAALGFAAKISDVYAATQWANRTFTNDDGMLGWTNGDGLSGDPLIALLIANGTTDTVDRAADWIAFADASESGAANKIQVDDLIPDASDTVAGILEVAVQSEMETGTSTILAVTPGRQHFHASAAKCTGNVTVSGGTPTLQSSYNVTSITDTAVGNVLITIATDFSSANYAVIAITDRAGASASTTNYAAPAVGSVAINSLDGTGTVAIDPTAYSFAFFGDQ